MEYTPTCRQLLSQYAWEYGEPNTDQAWILSPYDTWERNQHYSGPPVPHPESDDSCWDDGEATEAQEKEEYLDCPF